MEKQSHLRVVLKLGAAFTVGLLLFVLQFGATALWDWLGMHTLPFQLGPHFFRDGVLVLWFSPAILMLASIGVSIWSRRLLWISYIIIAAYWLWTYAFLALSF